MSEVSTLSVWWW